MGIEKLKRLKEFGKKVAGKVGGFLQKAHKVVDKIKPAFKVVKDFIPYGDVIDKGIEIGNELADRGGRALESIGKGENIKNVIKDTFSDYDSSQITKPINNWINNQPEQRRQNIRKAQDIVQKVVKTTSDIIDKTTNSSNFNQRKPEFISKGPIAKTSTQPRQPSFMNNVLN